MEFSKRMELFQESIFTILAKKAALRRENGKEVIDFSTGTPNIPPTKRIREVLANAALDPKNYVYAINDLPELIKAVIAWYKKRYEVILEDDEICSLLGSQEGLAHLAMTLINDSDIVLVPNPSYPIFKDGPLLANANIVDMPLKEENNYLIDFDKIDPTIAKKAKFMIVSYPNNPTCAIANDKFYLRLIDFAKKYQIIVLHDNAYSELLFEGLGRSFLSYPGAKDVGIEFNSLSKTYGLGEQNCVIKTREAYQRRRDIFLKCAQEIGWNIKETKGTMFIWAKIPSLYQKSIDFVNDLFEQTGILFIPGSAFGSEGEGYIRIALIQDEEIIKKAFIKMKATNIFKN